MDRWNGSTGIFNTLINPTRPRMDISTVIHHCAAYDLWANTRIADRLARESGSLLDEPVNSSFPSLRSTIMHVRNAEAAWFQRMSGIPQVWPAEASEDLSTFLKHVIVMCDYARSLSADDLLASATYKDLKGNSHSSPRWQALMHCFNHSSYHRGQLVTMMRTLGLEEIPAMDLIVFQRLAVQG
jgi:uncharacterized damage-inducible protein DinB